MSEHRTQFSLEGFADLDNSSNADFLIASMKAHYKLQSMKLIKKQAIDTLYLQRGDSVIELGCGLGYDANLMAEKVGEIGSITALDSSKRMLTEAKQLSHHQNILYYHGDAGNLDFPSNIFDACRADRLLVSQENIEQVFSEAVRVVKPQGRVSVTALDFGTLILYPANYLTEAISRYWQKLVKNPYVGRELKALFNAFQLNNLEVYPHVFMVDSYQVLKEIVKFETMLDDMENLKIITQSEKLSIIEVLARAELDKNFFWSINLITIVGIKK